MNLRQLENFVVYRDDRFHAAFPSVVCRPNGEILVAFRRAPDRSRFGLPHSHTDPNAHLVLVRSRDGGRTWGETPETIFAHPLGGSQDPCLNQLPDGTLVLTSYYWYFAAAEMRERAQVHGMRVQYHHDPPRYTLLFCGGYLLRSADGGHHWEGPIVPPRLAGSPPDPWGEPVPAYNRGAMCVGDDALYWAVRCDRPGWKQSAVHLLVSPDQGRTWATGPVVASDPNVSFSETFLYQTAGGDLVAFLRTKDLDGRTALARSRNGGRSFEPWQDAGFRGYPHHGVRLADGRLLLVYGYRFEPTGVRARIVDAECERPADAEEFLITDQGVDKDLGYPWAAMLPNGQILVVYYTHGTDGTRYIAGCRLAIA